MSDSQGDSLMVTNNPSSPVHAGEAERFGGWCWRDPERGEHFRRCSYCGSIHPEDLLTVARGRVDWADRKYGWPHKFYVHVPNRDPERLFVLGSGGGHLGDEPPYPGWVRMDRLTPEQEAVLEREGYSPGSRYRPTQWVGFGTRAEHFGKVYTVHLADPQLTEEVRADAAEMCGLRFEFLPDRRIAWAPTRGADA